MNFTWLRDLDHEYIYRNLQFQYTFPIPISFEKTHRDMGEGLRFQDASEFGHSLPAFSKKSRMKYLFLLAAGLGIEPKFSLSESDVRPLDDPAILNGFTNPESRIMNQLLRYSKKCFYSSRWKKLICDYNVYVV